MQALRVVYRDEVYIPLILHALCTGFPSPADDYIEGEIDLNRHLIANRPATFLFRVVVAIGNNATTRQRKAPPSSERGRDLG